MQDIAVSIATMIACFAFEGFLLSVGWNLSVHPLFDVRKISVIESFGVLILLKVMCLQLTPMRSRRGSEAT